MIISLQLSIIFKDTRKKKLNAVLDKIGTIEIEVFEDGHFVTYKTITKDTISNSLLPIGEDFLIIKIDKSVKAFYSLSCWRMTH